MPRSITSRWSLLNQLSTWFSQDEYVGVKWNWTFGMLLKKALDQIRFMSGEVVQDNVYIPIRGLRGHHFLQKRDKLWGGVSRGCLTDDFPGLGVESGVQRQRAVAMIFETVLFGAARR